VIVITRRDKTVANLFSAQRMEAIVETLELMADPEAMKGLRRVRFARPEAVAASCRAATEGAPDNSLRYESD
jgi:PHD/YefM family antitoxin component YafN of YafNO toxin-antitoxin module